MSWAASGILMGCDRASSGRAHWLRGAAVAFVVLMSTATHGDEPAPPPEGAGPQAEAPEGDRKVEAVAHGKLTGVWQGTYTYDAGVQQAVDFTMVVLQEGRTITGVIRERNTFGNQADPYLHASIQGTYDPTSQRIKFSKRYDGTGEVGHSVEYDGPVSNNGTQVIDGMWTLGGSHGGFTLNKNIEHEPGPWTGAWHGTQSFGEGSTERPLRCNLVIVQQGTELIGFMKEYGAGADAARKTWLHASIVGKLIEGGGALRFTKRYDGTGGRKGAAEFAAPLDPKQKDTLRGTWSEGDNRGEFAFERTLNARKEAPGAEQGPAPAAE